MRDDLSPELLAAVDAAVARHLEPIITELGLLPARLEAALRETPNCHPDLDDGTPTIHVL